MLELEGRMWGEIFLLGDWENFLNFAASKEVAYHYHAHPKHFQQVEVSSIQNMLLERV